MILICLNTVVPEACDERTAADVFSTGVEKGALLRDGLAGCRRLLRKPGAPR
jgi:hypothetical protein